MAKGSTQMFRLCGVTTLLIAALLLALPPVTAENPVKDEKRDEIPAAMKPYADKLLEVAKTYVRFGRFDDEMRWAPYLCRMPQAGRPQFSDSKDNETHGRKLYSLFAKDRADYTTRYA